MTLFRVYSELFCRIMIRVIKQLISFLICLSSMLQTVTERNGIFLRNKGQHFSMSTYNKGHADIGPSHQDRDIWQCNDSHLSIMQNHLPWKPNFCPSKSLKEAVFSRPKFGTSGICTGFLYIAVLSMQVKDLSKHSSLCRSVSPFVPINLLRIRKCCGSVGFNSNV